MSNTSATGGYLSPEGSPAPLEDAELDAVFQRAVVGITGLPGASVRPRWQPTMPKQPEPSVDWCAIGVMSQEADAGPAINHVAAGEGSDNYVRHEDIEVLATFYGPHCGAYATKFRDGISILQNIEGINADGVSFVDCGPVRSVPEIFNQQWIRRYDVAVRFRRKVSRAYPVLTVIAADAHLFDDTGHVDEYIQVPSAP